MLLITQQFDYFIEVTNCYEGSCYLLENDLMPLILISGLITTQFIIMLIGLCWLLYAEHSKYLESTNKKWQKDTEKN